jgi:hypothetical protein
MLLLVMKWRLVPVVRVEFALGGIPIDSFKFNNVHEAFAAAGETFKSCRDSLMDGINIITMVKCSFSLPLSQNVMGTLILACFGS